MPPASQGSYEPQLNALFPDLRTENMSRILCTIDTDSVNVACLYDLALTLRQSAANETKEIDKEYTTAQQKLSELTLNKFTCIYKLFVPSIYIFYYNTLHLLFCLLLCL